MALAAAFLMISDQGRGFLAELVVLDIVLFG
jgi:hypothetical protein